MTTKVVCVFLCVLIITAAIVAITRRPNPWSRASTTGQKSRLPIYFATTDTMQELQRYCTLPLQGTNSRFVVKAIAGGLSCLSLFANPSLPCTKCSSLLVFDVHEPQLDLFNFYSDLIQQSKTREHFIELFFRRPLRIRLDPETVESYLSLPPTLAAPRVRNISFYNNIIVPEISKRAGLRRLWPCWSSALAKRTGQFVRGSPDSPKKTSALFFDQAGWLHNEVNFRRTAEFIKQLHKQTETSIYDVSHAALWESYTHPCVLFLTNVDEGKWIGESAADFRLKLLDHLRHSKSSKKTIEYVSARTHAILLENTHDIVLNFTLGVCTKRFTKYKNWYNEVSMLERVKGEEHLPQLLHTDGQKLTYEMKYAGSEIHPDQRIKDLSSQLQKISDILTKKHIVHGDVHLEQFVIDSHGRVTLLDFEHAVDTSKGQRGNFDGMFRLEVPPETVTTMREAQRYWNKYLGTAVKHVRNV